MRKFSLHLFSILTLVFNLGLGQAVSAATQESESARVPAVKEWTFLIFLNGNNNLDRFGTLNLNQMEVVGSTNQVNVVAQWASYGAHRTKRLYIQKDNDRTRVTSPVIQDMGANVDMGDWHSLVDFVRWGVEHYPARHYFIDVWDHGSGWHDRMSRGGGNEIQPTDISWDDFTGHFMTTEQLATALKESAQIIGHKVDVYASDACLMAMAEIADEMADSVAYYAGSEELEPGEGWPYDELLKRWTAHPQSTGADVAKMLAEEYLRSYTGGTNGTQDVTFSAFDLSTLPELKRSIVELTTHLRTLNRDAKQRVRQAATQTMRFFTSDYADFGNFLRLIEGAGISQVDARLITATKNAMSGFVIANGASTLYSRATGLAIWMPGSTSVFDQYAERYRALNFDRDTHWSDFMNEIVRLTRND